MTRPTARPASGPAAADGARARDASGSQLVLLVAGRRLTLPLADIMEVLRPRPLTRVPLGPASLLGVANLRGGVLPVVSLAALLGQPVADPSPTARIVVLERGGRVGLLVDAVVTHAEGTAAEPVDLDGRLAAIFAGSRAPTRRVAGDGAPSPALAPVPAPPDAAPRALLGMRLAGQEFALPLACVDAVRRMPDAVSPLPANEPAMLGVLALGTGVLPLISLRILLGLPPEGAPDRHTRVVVARLPTGSVGLVVDAVTAVHQIEPNASDPVPPVLTRGASEARIEAICRLEGGRRLLSVLAPGGLFDDATLARLMARPAPGAAEETAPMPAAASTGDARQQFVVFQLGEEQYGLPIGAVAEVVRTPGALTRVPRAPAFVDGVMNLRGQVVPVIDQRRRFAVASDAATRSGRVVVVRLARPDAEDIVMGLAVDGVTDVLSVSDADIAPAPVLARAGPAALFDRVATLSPVAGRDGRIVLLVDPQALLDRVECDLLAVMAGGSAAADPAAQPPVSG